MRAIALAVLTGRRRPGAAPDRSGRTSGTTVAVALWLGAALTFGTQASGTGLTKTHAEWHTQAHYAEHDNPNPHESAQAAERVVTLAPHVTKMVFAAGAGDKVVATVNSSNYPPQALNIPRVGDGLSINAEQLLALQPDLIVGWQKTLALKKLMPVLSRLEIPVIYAEPQSLDDIPDQIDKLGHVLGTPDQASSKAQELRRQLATLRERYAGRNPVSVFIEVGTGPLYTLGNDPLTNDAITACGGVNIFGDSALVAPAVTIESVLARDPDVMIIAHTQSRHLLQRRQYWEGLHLRAAQDQHVYRIHPDMLVRPGPRLFQATQELCEHLDRARHDPARVGAYKRLTM